MKDLIDVRAIAAVVITLGVGAVTRVRKRRMRNRMRPQVTPLRLIHPDELDPRTILPNYNWDRAS